MSGHNAFAGHTWRAGRYLDALAPTHFLVDERSEAELIAFAAKLAGLLKFHDDATDAETATFRALFEGDFTILLAEMSVVDHARQYTQVTADEGADLEAGIAKAIAALTRWYQRLEGSCGRLDKPNPIAEELLESFEALVHQELDGLLVRDGPAYAAESGFARILRLAALAQAQDPGAFFSAINRVQQAISANARAHLVEVLSHRSDHPAHIGLYLAFARLMRSAQAHLNDFTERHLDHFYRDHLKLKQAPSQADIAHVWFQGLPGKRRTQWLPAGTVLGAGITPEGRAIEYETRDELILTDVQIEHIRAIQVNRADDGIVFSVKQAEHLEQVEIPPSDQAEGGGWRPFGPWDGQSAVVSSEAVFGLMVSAPILALADGVRTIEISLLINNPALFEKTPGMLDPNLFRHAVTVADGFFPVDAELTLDGNAVLFRITLPANAPPVEPFAGSGLRWPAWRVTLATDWQDYAYSRLLGVDLHDVKIGVTVEGMRAFSVRNPEGPVDISKPFTPFGGLPVVGAAMILSSPEWRGRNLTSFQVEMDWSNLPKDLGVYYADYGGDIRTGSFRAALTRLEGNRWNAVAPMPLPPRQEGMTFPLFTAPPLGPEAGTQPDPSAEEDQSGNLVDPYQKYAFRLGDTGMLPPRDHYARPQGTERAIDTSGSTFRMTLTAPALAFGHAVYPGLVANASLNQALELSKGPTAKLTGAATKFAQKGVKWVAEKIGAETDEPAAPAVLLLPPFAPMVKDFRIGYTAEVSLNLALAGGAGEVYRLDSFGRRKRISSKTPLVEALSEDGFLFLGLSGVDLINRHPISLLFHINDQAGENRVAGDSNKTAAVDWCYLSAAGWERFPSDGVRVDETRGLIQSGIVKLDPQPGMCGDTDSPDLVWVRASSRGNMDRFGSILGVHANAISAVRSSKVEAVNGRWTLPAGSIKQISSQGFQVTAVHQPFQTKDGQPPESTLDFRVRVSERLRHKNRAVQPQDYEQLTLTRFPDVGDAKCLTGPNGQVTLVVGPVRQESVRMMKAAGGRLVAGSAPQEQDRKPKLSAGRLLDIQEYLEGLAPAAAGKLVVRSPIYDQVRVSAWIDADDRELDVLLYGLEQAADKAIAPWLYDPEAPLSIGPAESRVDISKVQQALAQVAHVKAVSAVSLLQIIEAEGLGQDAKITHSLRDTASVEDQSKARHAALAASSEWNVLTPARRHNFRILKTPKIRNAELRREFRVVSAQEAQDESQERRMIYLERAGIGNLSIGSELVICEVAGEVAGKRPVYRVKR